MKNQPSDDQRRRHALLAPNHSGWDSQRDPFRGRARARVEWDARTGTARSKRHLARFKRQLEKHTAGRDYRDRFAGTP
jgi:hypothetical protein